MYISPALKQGYTEIHPGFALYRALLRQVRRLPEPDDRTNFGVFLKRITKRNSKLQGHRDIAQSLNIGYKVGFTAFSPNYSPSYESDRPWKLYMMIAGSQNFLNMPLNGSGRRVSFNQSSPKLKDWLPFPKSQSTSEEKLYAPANLNLEEDPLFNGTDQAGAPYPFSTDHFPIYQVAGMCLCLSAPTAFPSCESESLNPALSVDISAMSLLQEKSGLQRLETLSMDLGMRRAKRDGTIFWSQTLG